MGTAWTGEHSVQGPPNGACCPRVPLSDLLVPESRRVECPPKDMFTQNIERELDLKIGSLQRALIKMRSYWIRCPESGEGSYMRHKGTQPHRERPHDDKQRLQGYDHSPASRERQELERQEGRP